MRGRAGAAGVVWACGRLRVLNLLAARRDVLLSLRRQESVTAEGIRGANHGALLTFAPCLLARHGCFVVRHPPTAPWDVALHSQHGRWASQTSSSGRTRADSASTPG